MMFNYSFQMQKAAEVIESAIERTLAKGFRTADIFSDGCKLVSTDKMTDAVIENFQEIFNEQALGVFTL